MNAKRTGSIITHLPVMAGLFLIWKGTNQLMAKIDDIKAALASAATSVSNEIAAGTAAIAAAKANSTGPSDADLDEVLTDVNNLKAEADAATATFNGTVTTPPPSGGPPSE